MKGFGIYVKNNLLEPKHVEKMGGSPLFLYLWLLDKMTSVNENGVGKVLGNRPVTYEEIEADLGISEATYTRWIKRLRGEGYINTLRAPYGLVITVHKAEKIFGRRTVNGEGTKRPSSVKSEGTVPSKVTDQNNKYDGSNKDNTKTIQLDNTSKATRSPEREEISKLFYEIINALSLPKVNNNNIRKWITELATLKNHEEVITYLVFMRDNYPKVDWEFKPAVTQPVHILLKRLQVIDTYQRAVKEQQGRKVFRI